MSKGKLTSSAFNQALLLLIFIFWGSGCEDGVYSYQKGFSQYMLEVHSIDLDDLEDKIIYTIPISDCTTCQSTLVNLELLNALDPGHKNLIIILAGRTNNSVYKNLIKSISSRFVILKDTENMIFNYPTGVAKPMLVHIKKGRVFHYLNIDDFKIEEAEKYVSSNS